MRRHADQAGARAALRLIVALALFGICLSPTAGGSAAHLSVVPSATMSELGESEVNPWLERALVQEPTLTDTGPGPQAPPPRPGLFGHLANTVCATTRVVGGLAAGLSLLRDRLKPLSETACLLRLLEYEFHTVAEVSGGRPVVRTHKAIIGLPTPLNVDGRPGPDLIGTVRASGDLDKLQLTVDRAAGSNAPIAASVEVVASDPTGAVGAEQIAFGYDQRDDRVPAKFGAEVLLDRLLSDEPALDLRVTQGGASGLPLGARTSLIASTFDGNASQRTSVIDARVDFARSPSAARLELVMAGPSSLRLITDRPGPVTGYIAFDGEQQDIAVQIEAQDMPRVFEVDFDLENPRIRYTGTDERGTPQTIDRLEVQIESDAPLLGRATRFRATVGGLSSGTELVADAEQGEFSLIATEPIAVIEVFAGSDPERAGDLPANGAHGARISDRPGEPFVMGARVTQLRALRARVGESMSVDAVAGGGQFALQAELDGLEVAAEIDALPERISMNFNVEDGVFGYTGSSPIGRVQVALDSDSPVVAGANELTLLLEDIPVEVDLRADLEEGSASFVANAPLGLVEISAQSSDAVAGSGLLDPGQSGLVLRDSADEFVLFARMHGLRELTVSTEPMAVTSVMEAGRPFVADANLELASGSGDVLRARLEIDELPSELRLNVAETDASGASAITYRASQPIGRVALDVTGIELLEGADTARAVIHDLPTDLDLVFPAQGPLATVTANAPIGQLLLAAGDGDVSVPPRSIAGDPVLNDLFQFETLPGAVSAAARLTAVRSLSVSLDPINVSLSQDAARARPIDLRAAFESEAGDEVNVEALLDKPGARTSMSVDLAPGQPTRLVFDNAAPLSRFEMRAEGLPGIEKFDAVFENVSPRLAICMDPGPLCRRPNRNILVGDFGGVDGGRPYPAAISMDFEDFGTHVAGSPSKLNAEIQLIDGEPIVVDDLVFENLSLDFGLGETFKGPCTFGTTNPRLYMFFDSRNRPFVINSVKFPPLVKDFQIGTSARPARANSRIAWLRGCQDRGFEFKLDRREGGTMECGGRRRLVTSQGDVLDKPLIGQAIRLCGD